MSTIDCDVHCFPAREELYPYLSEHWRSFAADVQLNAPPAVQLAYPSQIDAFATNAENTKLADIQDTVFSEADLAVLNCYYGVESFSHPYLGPAVATAINEWLRDAFLEQDDRLRGSAVVTPQFPAAAVEEIRRVAADPRFVQILVPARSPAGYGDQRYWPIWDEAVTHNLPVAITYGGGGGIPPTSISWPPTFFETYVTAPVNFQSHLTSLVVSGIFDRNPTLRFVMMESGWAFLPQLFWRLDANWPAYQRETPWVSEAPSVYIKRHVRFTTSPIDGPTDLAELRLIVGQLESRDILMYGSDFPHRYAGSPLFEALEPEHRERVLSRNALEWYRLDRFPTEV